MAAGVPENDVRPAQEEDACVAGASIADLLRLLSSGATGEILMALGDGPLRTKGLTQRVPGYSPRTIYRYAGKLAELEVLERDEEPGVPSKVVLFLTDPCGKELYDLVDRYATASLTRLPNGRIDSHSWASLGLLADLWELGIVDELSCDPRTSTEMARGRDDFSYHQVNRRAGMFAIAGLLDEEAGSGRRRCFRLAERTRRSMALIAGIGRWRHHHVVAEDEEGMTSTEMATLLQASLPLVRLPRHAGKCLRLNIVAADAPHGDEGDVVWAEVEDDGTVHSCPDPTPTVDAWARGRIKTWVPVPLEGDLSGLLLGGDAGLIGDCFSCLHEILWSPPPQSSQ
jgi:DNA-binding HxlR family transcriptional regulator